MAARPRLRRRRRTKIIATLGPASSTPEVLARLFLTDELGKLLRAQRSFRRILLAALGGDELVSRRRRHRSDPRRYLFGNRSAMATTPGAAPFGTITRAFGS